MYRDKDNNLRHAPRKDKAYVTTKELAKELSLAHPNLTQKEAMEIIKDFLDRIMDHAYQGDEVRLRGFGTFRPHKRTLPKSFVESELNKDKMDVNKLYFWMQFIFSRRVRQQYTNHLSTKEPIHKATHGRKRKQ